MTANAAAPTRKSTTQKNTTDDLERRATEALRALLGEVSVIRLMEIERTSKGAMLARVDVLGHSHTLACEIKLSEQPENLRMVLQTLHDDAARYDSAATPVLIAPHFSPETQKLCKECSTGYLDLEGNARLALGEVFIGKRSLRVRGEERNTGRGAEPAVLRGFPPTRVLAPVAGARNVA
jgi:hypothetical protein